MHKLSIHGLSFLRAKNEICELLHVQCMFDF